MGIVRLVHSLRSREDTLSVFAHYIVPDRNRIMTRGYVCRFAVKATLVGGIVYYSVHQGLWSKSEDSVQLYGKIYNNIAPYVKNNIPKEVVNELPPLPSTSDLSYFIKSSWNKGIITSTKFLSNTPTYVTNGAQNIFETVQGYITQQNVSQKSQ